MTKQYLDVSYIIAYRESKDPYRKRNLLYNIRFINKHFDGVEIIIAEDDKTPTMSKRELPKNVKYVFCHHDGPFNKAWAFNCAVKTATTKKIIVFADGDIIAPPGAYIATAQVFDSEAETASIDLYGGFINAKHILSDRIISGEEDPFEKPVDNLNVYAESFGDGSFIDSHSPLFGGLNMIRKSLFYGARGCFEEIFDGWGAEDISFGYLLSKISKVGRLNACAVHLCHWPARGSENRGNPTNEPNWQLFLQLKDKLDSKENAIKLINERSLDWGNPERYPL